MNKNLVAVVLAGGIGKRFWPLRTYKSMLRFLGKSLLESNILHLINAGIQKICIIANQEDRERVESIHLNNTKIQIVIQKQPLGMADALLSARNEINNQACLVVNAEDVVDDTLYTKIREEARKGQAFVVGKKVQDYQDLGYLQLDKDRLAEVVEKPGKGNEPSDLVNLVFHFFPDVSIFLKTLEQAVSDKDDIYEKALSLYAKHVVTHVIPYDGLWYPIKYPWHTLDIMAELLKTVKSHRGKNVVIKQNVIIEGEVYIGDNVQIFENTKIVGPAYIGNNTIIGNNNIIRQSHIGADCVTGFNTDITRSYVGDACWFHSNYIGDSVLEGTVSMGSGAVLANLRLDEGEIFSVVKNEKIHTGRTKLGAIIGRNVRIGVNVSIMPGVKIGGNSSLGAGITVDRDIPDNSFCVGTSTLTISPNKFDNASLSRDELKKTL